MEALGPHVDTTSKLAEGSGRQYMLTILHNGKILRKMVFGSLSWGGLNLEKLRRG
jgi:hypothetical protein